MMNPCRSRAGSPRRHAVRPRSISCCMSRRCRRFWRPTASRSSTSRRCAMPRRRCARTVRGRVLYSVPARSLKTCCRYLRPGKRQPHGCGAVPPDLRVAGALLPARSGEHEERRRRAAGVQPRGGYPRHGAHHRCGRAAAGRRRRSVMRVTLDAAHVRVRHTVEQIEERGQKDGADDEHHVSKASPVRDLRVVQ
jgi:hypothetical protein